MRNRVMRMGLPKPGDGAVVVLPVSEVGTAAPLSRPLSVGSERCRPEPGPVAARPPGASLCPSPPVTARQLSPAAAVSPPPCACLHIRASRLLCCPTVFVTMSLTQIRVLLKPVFCFIIIIFVSLGRRFL